MEYSATEIESILVKHDLLRLEKFVSFENMLMALEDAQKSVGDTGPQLLLRHMTGELKLKPSFTTDGFSIVSIDGPNVECPPPAFSFEGDWPKPSRAVGETFYPLIKKADLHKYYAHSIRWFKHPLRPGMMLPLRLETFYLGVDHPVSRMYVDVPVVFKGRKYLSYLRVSLTVFEIILGAQTGQLGRWINLTKAGSAATNVTDKGAPSVEDHMAMWDLFGAHEEQFAKNRHYVEDKDPCRYAVRVVADHLVKLG